MEVALSLLLDTSDILLQQSFPGLMPPPPWLIQPSIETEIDLFRKKKRQKTRHHGFLDITIPGYHAAEFQQNFRLQRTTFEIILNRVRPYLMHEDAGRPQINPETQLLMSIWLLATPESFRGVAERFGFERGNCHRILFRCLDAIQKACGHFIKWPDSEGLEVLAREFSKFRRRNFPGAIGCVDGCHIPIKQPSRDKSSYYNRNKYHSIILQGVCDHKMQFIDVFIGWPGSTHDARVWQNSPIYAKIKDGGINEDYHLLGDSAYPISTFLQAPFKDDGHLTPQQKHFNRILSSTRLEDEHGFPDDGGQPEQDNDDNPGEITGADKRLEICSELFNGYLYFINSAVDNH